MSTICILEPTHWGRLKGGAEIQTHYLADWIARTTTHRVIFLARFVPDDVTGYAYEIRRYQSIRGFESLRWGQSLDSLSICRQLGEINPDVILQMQAGAYLGAGSFYALRQGIPFFWYIASDRDLFPAPPVGTNSPFKHLDRLLFSFGWRHATHIIAQTQAQRATLKKNMGRKALGILGNFHPAPDVCSKSDTPLVVAWIANLKALKRPGLFVDLAEAFRTRNDIRFIMAGRNDGSADSTNAITRLGQLPNAEYCGELSLEEVGSLLAKSHVLVNTSDYEGFPNVFIQAWLHGAAVLSINVDPDDVMAKQDIGKRCTSLAQLVSELSSLAADRNRLDEMGSKAAAYSRRNFSMANADKLITWFEESIGQRRPPPPVTPRD
jgi:glycosyltransferase involved in cell wall biosynthesis